jgi:hypothetical protein
MRGYLHITSKLSTFGEFSQVQCYYYYSCEQEEEAEMLLFKNIWWSNPLDHEPLWRVNPKLWVKSWATLTNRFSLRARVAQLATPMTRCSFLPSFLPSFLSFGGHVAGHSSLPIACQMAPMQMQVQCAAPKQKRVLPPHRIWSVPAH